MLFDSGLCAKLEPGPHTKTKGADKAQHSALSKLTSKGENPTKQIEKMFGENGTWQQFSLTQSNKCIPEKILPFKNIIQRL